MSSAGSARHAACEQLRIDRRNEPIERRGNAHRGRRPRFLARRKPGGLGVRLMVQGEEIIARG